MTKWKDTTKGGHRILWREEIKEGERKGWSFGKIDMSGSSTFIIWDEIGNDIDGTASTNLSPAEPEVTHSRWINLYPNILIGVFYNMEEVMAEKCRVTGTIRIDWLSDGTFTVNKEEA